jgi:hypothetical protein
MSNKYYFHWWEIDAYEIPDDDGPIPTTRVESDRVVEQWGNLVSRALAKKAVQESGIESV